MVVKKDKAQDIEKFYSIVEKISQNPQKGLEAFYDEYGGFVYLIATIFSKGLVTPQEIFQEVLITMNDWAQKQDPKNFRLITLPRGWLYRVTSNKAKSLLRGEARRCVPLSENIPDTSDEIEKMIAKNSFYSIIKNLSRKEQKVLIYKFQAKLTFERIAKHMKMSPNTVSSMYYRAIDKLKEESEKNPEKFY